jgi:prephenate dehydrogenase
MALTGPVAVVGLGLIGGSLARRLHAVGVDVVGYDAAGATRAAATAVGIECVDALADLGAYHPDVVVLAVPLRGMRHVAGQIARHVPDASVTDVGSVKGAVRAAMTAAGLADRYVGAHPMAGTEHSGFESSSADLLTGASWALTVDGATSAEAFLAVLDLVIGPLGGTARVLSDEVHDEAVALISHVPHVVATELLTLVADAPVRDVALGLAAGSFRDGTRVGRTDPRRTEAMVADNSRWVASALRVVIRDLELLVADLESNAPVGMFFDRARHVRTALESAAQGVTVAGVEPTLTSVKVGRPGWVQALVVAGATGAVVAGFDPVHAVVTLSR